MFVTIASYKREEAKRLEREKADKERRENLEIARVCRHWFYLSEELRKQVLDACQEYDDRLEKLRRYRH